MRPTIRIIILLAAVLSVVLVVPAVLTGQPEETTVDLAAQASSRQCTTCHAIIAESDRPGLIFAHGAHLLVNCDVCHERVTHQAGVTYIPTMRSCFLCHGLEHGPQGLMATAECASCHPPGFELRPSSHVKDWAEEPHALATRAAGTNPCLLCHSAPEDCDACHVDEGLDIEPIFEVYMRVVAKSEEAVPVEINPDAPPSMGSCVFCHPDLDTPGDPGLVFAHTAHLSRDYACETCHERFPHRADETDRPPMLSCYRCHSLQHAAQGEVAAQECEKCHPTDFELKPVDHTRSFASGKHKDVAYARMTECTMCHASAFCAECHIGGFKMANGKLSQAVLPLNHRTPEWQTTHGRDYLNQQGSCSVCHSPGYCGRCHLTPMPHPTEWLAKHGSNGYPTDDCRVCHSDRNDCQDCHHQGLVQAELIKENCVECHEEVDVEDATTIKNIPLAEHAVHFNVEESKGRPYICEDCHIGFTATSVMQPAVATQVHDLRVCYDCHGNLDVNNVAVAPYPGKELCYRCHRDLNL